MSMPMLGGMPPMGGVPPMPPGIGGLPPMGGGRPPVAGPPQKKKTTPASAKNKALADKLKGGGKK